MEYIRQDARTLKVGDLFYYGYSINPTLCRVSKVNGERVWWFRLEKYNNYDCNTEDSVSIKSPRIYKCPISETRLWKVLNEEKI